MGRIFTSLIQSDFGATNKNFEAVVLEGRDLWHWWRDNSVPGKFWHRGQRILSNQAAFPASIIQSNFGSGSHGNFEVVVPVFEADGNIALWHFWHDNSDVNKPWQQGQRITETGRLVIGPAAIIQSNFRTGDFGNFEISVPVINDQGHAELRHYWHDNSDVHKHWRLGQRINDPLHEVLGAGALIQSNLGSGEHGNFEVCGFVRLPDGRTGLQHYWHDNSDVNKPWQNGQLIATGVKGPGVMIQSSFGAPPGNFEVVVPIESSVGQTCLQHFWHDNSDVHLPWRPGQTITEIVSTSGTGCLIESDYRTDGPGNFELLVDECQQSLSGYWHSNDDVTAPWLQNALLLAEAPGHEIRNTKRICQLTGEFDRMGWNGSGQPPTAFNKTETRFGIRGTDLGVSFEHKNRIYFLFGDTWRVGESDSSHFDWDAIAFCTDTIVQGGLALTFYKQPPIAHGISQGAFEVPLDGFSFRGLMFVFFSTDHRQLGDAQLMGRSVLGVSENDGYDFKPMLTFSRSKFINVSVERAQLDPAQAKAIGWQAGTEVLWIWGSGRYRSSPAYLAVANLNLLIDVLNTMSDHWPVEPGPIMRDHRLIQFFTGNSLAISWSSNEQDAVPLFCAGDIGELSCRRNQTFSRFFITYNTGNPRGIVLRHALMPWGPWSEAILILDPNWDAYGKFMHIPWNEAHADNVQDDMFLKGKRDNEWGGEYGPYQITRFSTGVLNQSCDLIYTMSTWNPYESMLMRTQITAEDLKL